MKKSAPILKNKQTGTKLPHDIEIIIKFKNAFRRLYQNTRKYTYKNAMSIFIKIINKNIDCVTKSSSKNYQMSNREINLSGRLLNKLKTIECL